MAYQNRYNSSSANNYGNYTGGGNPPGRENGGNYKREYNGSANNYTGGGNPPGRENGGNYKREYNGSDENIKEVGRTSPYITGQGLNERTNSMGLDFTQMNARQLQDARRMEEARQDQYLDQIGQGVRNLKNIALGIDDEVTTQNRMLDDMTNNVEDATRVVQEQADRAKQVRRAQKKICGLYVLIGTLVVVIVLVQIFVPDN